MKIIKTIFGIDPGTGGGIAELKQTSEGMKLITHKMPSTFMGIVELFKPHAGLPDDTEIRASIELISQRPNFSPFANSRMQPLFDNVRDIKNALEINNIPYQEVSPRTWQKKLQLITPNNKEKGVDYEELKKLKNELKTIQKHISIQNNKDLDKIKNQDVIYILENNGKKEARKALNDTYWDWSKYDLNKHCKEIEKDIENCELRLKMELTKKL